MISAFVCVTNPETWKFPYLESIESFCALADEVVVVDGRSTDGSREKIQTLSEKVRIITVDWPWEFKQREFPIHLNFGLNECKGDWVLKFDADFVLHEHDALAFKRKLMEAIDDPHYLVASYTRLNVVNRFQGIFKSPIPWIIHKKFTESGVMFGIEKGKQFVCDWSQPVVVEKRVNGIPFGWNPMTSQKSVLPIGNHVFNYDCTFREKEKCREWFLRLAKAYRDETNIPLYGHDDEEAWNLWRSIRWRQKEKNEKRDLKLDDHPKYIQNRLKAMASEMWGYANWDWKL